MTTGLPLLHAMLAGSLLLPAAGCTRTYDGTIVPAYQPRLVQTRLMPVVVLRPTPTDPPNLKYRFPQPPAAAAPVRQTERRVAARRPVVVRPMPANPPPVNRSTVRCRNETQASGRVRVVCA